MLNYSVKNIDNNLVEMIKAKPGVQKFAQSGD